MKVHNLERRKRLVMVPKRLLEYLLECKQLERVFPRERLGE